MSSFRKPWEEDRDPFELTARDLAQLIGDCAQGVVSYPYFKVMGITPRWEDECPIQVGEVVPCIGVDGETTMVVQEVCWPRRPPTPEEIEFLTAAADLVKTDPHQATELVLRRLEE